MLPRAGETSRGREASLRVQSEIRNHALWIEIIRRFWKENWSKLAVRPQIQPVSVSRARRISGLTTRIRCPRFDLRSQLDDHPPARALPARRVRWAECRRS